MKPIESDSAIDSRAQGFVLVENRPLQDPCMKDQNFDLLQSGLWISFGTRNYHHQLRLAKSIPKMVLKSSGVDGKAVSEEKRVSRKNLDPKPSPSASS